jgi:hypothetical protein
LLGETGAKGLRASPLVAAMGKKKKGGKSKKGPAEPVDPYAGFLVLNLKFGAGAASKGVQFTAMMDVTRLTAGDLFRELWRQTEMNEEFDEPAEKGEDEGKEGGEEEERKFVIFGPIVGDKASKTLQQVQCIYRGDQELHLQADLGFKTGDVVTFDSLAPKAWSVMLKGRPQGGWKALLDEKWLKLNPPPPLVEEEGAGED